MKRSFILRWTKGRTFEADPRRERRVAAASAAVENDAVIIESFGVGGLPTDGGYSRRAQGRREGKIVVMTTQVQNEGSDLGVYQVGHVLKDVPGVLKPMI